MLAKEEIASSTENHTNCPFCTIFRDNQREFIIKDRETTALILSLEGHPLIVPKKHVRFEDIDPELASNLGQDIFKYTPRIIEIYQTEGLNILTNIGRAAGQDIEHFHIHLIPRIIGDNKVNLNGLVRISDRKRRDIMLKFQDPL
ncbi:MAG: hypothetical protein ACD_30C00003G0008 [uncultured bacterium]|uniref:HIT domain-containing protein n=3 Tax=Candidatus Daviesiibacteriota TaxID=1752718 RepID=A0A0G0H5T1_9BACT|nr:MAG: hypothetical protein ACD_30C00003G0008 [uncultured bacterium]KKQ07439.1 MAG: hypothetical protein US19_C0046G0007 [Candidatus Daviesbacteria bacterium GW2011_GWB1_36_5]OGE16615.1 MAG: hypothetical protein A2858_02100 [Candidatus Daviesbacteria bacterium RIFCSPHIGHO2_01_FULL_36_37]OGE34698.1 MAG: hypothetical protein A3E66_03660 [Candidatus Daviesbacteria bacterium RIFCSPHIGHO2_12_FULL_37_16]